MHSKQVMWPDLQDYDAVKSACADTTLEEIVGDILGY